MFSGKDFWKLAPAQVILLTGVLLFLANWAVVFWHLERLYQEQVIAVQRENRNLANVFAFHTERVLAAADQVLLLARAEYEGRGRVSESLDFLIKGLANTHMVMQVAMADRNGQVIHAALPSNSYVNDREYFRVHQEGRAIGVYVGQTLQGRVSGQMVIHLSRRLTAADGSFDGILFISLMPDVFVRIHNGLALPETQSLVLVGKDGVVRVRRDAGRNYYEGNMKLDHLLDLAATRTEGECLAGERRDGDGYFLSYRSLQAFPLVAIASRDQADALAWFRSQRLALLQSASAAGVVIVLVTGILYRFFRRYDNLSQRYAAIVNQSREALVLASRRDGRIQEVNDQYLALTGYSRQEAIGLHLREVFPHGAVIGRDRNDHQVCWLGRKDGGRQEVETSRSVIAYGHGEGLLFSARDVSAERARQRGAEQELVMAAAVQRSLLPQGFREVLVAVDTVYEAKNIVSGDYYDFMWSEDHQRFAGFLLDISGHGVASSLQGIVAGSFFRDVFQSPMRGANRLQWINRQISRYFSEESYCAAICFELDFGQRTLTYICAGIYRFLSSSVYLPAVVTGAGSLIGITEDPEFTAISVAIAPGDAFYFLSDGLYEQIDQMDDLPTADYPDMLKFLRQLSRSDSRRDDCSAVCIRILDRPVYPLRLEWHHAGEHRRIRSRLAALLADLAGADAVKIEIAVGEALNNAARESMDVCIRVNRIGRRLVIRVKDGGEGFDGNLRVERLFREGETVFEDRLLDEGGRGIYIMAAWMDKVMYNQRGNEVLLMKYLSKNRQIRKNNRGDDG